MKINSYAKQKLKDLADIRQAYDAIEINEPCKAEINLGIPRKLVTLVQMTLEEIRCIVEVAGHTSDSSGVTKESDFDYICFKKCQTRESYQYCII